MEYQININYQAIQLANGRTWLSNQGILRTSHQASRLEIPLAQKSVSENIFSLQLSVLRLVLALVPANSNSSLPLAAVGSNRAFESITINLCPFGLEHGQCTQAFKGRIPSDRVTPIVLMLPTLALTLPSEVLRPVAIIQREAASADVDLIVLSAGLESDPFDGNLSPLSERFTQNSEFSLRPLINNAPRLPSFRPLGNRQSIGPSCSPTLVGF